MRRTQSELHEIDRASDMRLKASDSEVEIDSPGVLSIFYKFREIRKAETTYVDDNANFLRYCLVDLLLEPEVVLP